MAKWVYNFGDGKAAADAFAFSTLLPSNLFCVFVWCCFYKAPCPRFHVINWLESQVSGQHQLSSSLVSHTSFALWLLPLPGDTGFTRDRLTAALR